MASDSGKNKSIFEQLHESTTPESIQDREKRNLERAKHENEQAHRRLADLIDNNATLPTTIHSVRILNAHHTRTGFLRRIFDPLLAHNNARPLTLGEALGEISQAAETLHKHDIFEHPVDLYIDRPDPSDPGSSPTDINVFLSVKEKSRLQLKTGTEVGNAEGNAYASVFARNLLGGAEALSFHAGMGTRTRSQYQGTFETPILSNPDFKWQLGGADSTTQKAFASHDEGLREAWTRLRWASRCGHSHELTYSGGWRQVTGLAREASPSVRADAGDSFKSSLTHSWRVDRRDYPLLPQRGYYAKTLLELAGWGPLRGDVAFAKAEAETQVALPLLAKSGISLTASLRAGLLCPLGPPTAAGSSSGGSPSRRPRISDRFQLGGPADVRGFRTAGLGPRDGRDAVGGDAYAAASAALLVPVPRVGADRPFRLQAFVNAGRLLALPSASEKKGGVAGALADLAGGAPSVAAGVGVVYAHPVARFELNFCLPLVLRRGEEGRKGLQFGIGFNLL